jgi:hypothetical protein
MSMLALIKMQELLGQPVLGFEGDGDDLGWLTLSASIQDERSACIVAIVPGCLDQQAPEVNVAGFGDRSQTSSLTGRVFRGNKPDVGHEFARRRETADVIDLADDSESCEKLHAAQTAKRFDPSSEGRRLGMAFEFGVQALDLGLQILQMLELHS